MAPGTSAELDASLTYVELDTWGGIPSFTITTDGVPPAVPVASCKMQFRPNANTFTPSATLENGAGITITSAANWEFSIPQQELDLKAGQYVWSFVATDDNGVVQTYMQGNIEVLKRITAL